MMAHHNRLMPQAASLFKRFASERKVLNCMCEMPRLRSSCANARADRSLGLRYKLFMRKGDTLSRLSGCSGLSESSLFAHVKGIVSKNYAQMLLLCGYGYSAVSVIEIDA